MKKIAVLAFVMFAALMAGAQTNPCGGTVAHCNVFTIVPAPTQPTGVVVTGWNVYKSATSKGYTLGKPFMTVPVATLTVQDNTVTGGQTNFYAFTALDATENIESVFSPELTAFTPVDVVTAPTITVKSF